MTVTATRRGDLPYRIEGAQKKTVTNIAFDTAYPTGGEILTAANLGLNRVDYAEATVYSVATTSVNAAQVSFVPSATTGGGALFVFDETPAEIANDADIAGLVAQVVAYGTYLEGGETLSAASLGLNKVEYATCTVYSIATTSVNIASASYDPTASLLHLWDNTPAEVAGAAAVEGAVVQVLAYGQ